MKRLKLNLDQLGEELGILDPGYLQGIKGGYGNSSGSYGGYNSWQELWDAMQNGYLPPAGTYNPGGSGSYGGYGNYGGYSGYGGYNGGWPGWYPPGGGGYGGYGSGGSGSYGGYGGYGGYGDAVSLIDDYINSHGGWSSWPGGVVPGYGYIGPSVNVYSGHNINPLNSPVGSAPISSAFNDTRDCENCSNIHGGTDYRVPVGTNVEATASGTVVRSYFSNSYGNVVIIDHGTSSTGEGNVYTLYAHGSSRNVDVGELVEAGESIMSSGNTGKNTTGPHLHYEVIVTTDSPFSTQFFKDHEIRYSPESLENFL